MSLIPNDLPDAEIPGQLGALLGGLYSGPARLPFVPGGRKAALERLKAFNPARYGSRNHLEGGVSGLSPYLRHGMVSMAEVARAIRTYKSGKDRNELLRQLSWREFFYLVLEQEGEAKVLENLELPKYNARWSDTIPDDIRAAQTGLPCVDAWVSRLEAEGYLHNHERLWFGAYWVHFRKLHWKAGYRLFREHLLDGDVGNNALSWQWVASTFSQKPYFMNKDNIERYSAGKWCRGCTADCPFDFEYETLEKRLFGPSFSRDTKDRGAR